MRRTTAGSSATCSPQQHILILDLADRSAITTKKVSEASTASGQGRHSLILVLKRRVAYDADSFFLPAAGYLSFEIPQVPRKREDCWDLMMTRNGSISSVHAVSPSESSEQGQFIGRLNLQQLGYRDRRKRKDGKLGQARIVNAV